MKRNKFYYLTHPSVGIPALLAKVSDRYAIEQMWKSHMDYPLNLDNPQTFNEKLQWLKLYDHNPLYTTLVDKYKVKEWVAQKIGTQYVIPTLGIYQSVDEIDLDKLPDRFVLKCNHDSGSVQLCKDKNMFDFTKAKKSLEQSLKKNFYYKFREWAYKDVKPLIIAEEYMMNGNKSSLTDYKFYCFNGIPKFLYVSYELANHDSAYVNYATLDWKQAPFHRPDFKEMKDLPSKPLNLDLMIVLSSKLSKDLPFVRVDLYEINGEIYFSELTMYPGAGFTPFIPEEWDFKVGDFLTLPKRN